MNKGGALFLDHFARLGLFGKVLSLAGPLEDNEGASSKDDKVWNCLVAEASEKYSDQFLRLFLSSFVETSVTGSTG